MSNHETDPKELEESYQSDDPDTNIIPGYIIQNSESVENVSDNSSKDESAAGMAYREEPLAGQEWLENYNRQENERLELKEKLERRLDGPCKYDVDFYQILNIFHGIFFTGVNVGIVAFNC